MLRNIIGPISDSRNMLGALFDKSHSPCRKKKTKQKKRGKKGKLGPMFDSKKSIFGPMFDSKKAIFGPVFDSTTCVYIYSSWDICCPHFAQKCHFFPSFIANMAQNNWSIYGQIFCIFWILSKCNFNQFLEDVRM